MVDHKGRNDAAMMELDLVNALKKSSRLTLSGDKRL